MVEPIAAAGRFDLIAGAIRIIEELLTLLFKLLELFLQFGAFTGQLGALKRRVNFRLAELLLQLLRHSLEGFALLLDQLVTVEELRNGGGAERGVGGVRCLRPHFE